MADGFASKPADDPVNAGSDTNVCPACDDGPHALAELLRHGRYEMFNARVHESGPADLTDANLRMADLTHANLKGACLKGAYLRACDLRGLDLSGCDLFGASMFHAKVSGVLFPDNVDAHEITMSVTLGTRIRTRRVG